ncbi:hypothetical protein ACWEK5_37270 [Rhodococcus koreensis]
MTRHTRPQVTTNPAPPDAAGLRAFAENKIGYTITVHRRRDGWRDDEPAQIVAVVPSRGHLCWLVEYTGGGTDVIRIDDPTCHYTLQKALVDSPLRRSQENH